MVFILVISSRCFFCWSTSSSVVDGGVLAGAHSRRARGLNGACAGTWCSSIRASRRRSPSRSASRREQKGSRRHSSRTSGADRGSGGDAPRRQEVNAERKFFPGYVLVKMEMTDEAWHLVKDTPKVTGFLGAASASRRRSPRPRRTVSCQQVQEGVERPKPSVTFEIGEQVRVCDGPFTSFNGLVEEVDEERGAAQGRGVDLRPGDARSNWNTARSRSSRGNGRSRPMQEARETGREAKPWPYHAQPQQMRMRKETMAKKIDRLHQAAGAGGQANPSPPVGPALGQRGA